MQDLLKDYIKQETSNERILSLPNFWKDILTTRLPSEEKSLVEGHLSHCQICQDALKAMDGLRHLIKDPVDELDRKENFYRVWQKIEREIQQEEKLGMEGIAQALV